MKHAGFLDATRRASLLVNSVRLDRRTSFWWLVQRRPNRFSPARWMTASACPTPRARLASDQSKDAPPDAARRLTGNTSCPAATRRFERCGPMNPDAPVSRTFMPPPALSRTFPGGGGHEHFEPQLLDHAALQKRLGHRIDHSDQRFDRDQAVPEDLSVGGSLRVQGGNPLAKAFEHRIPLPPLADLNDVPDGFLEICFRAVGRLTVAGLAMLVDETPTAQVAAGHADGAAAHPETAHDFVGRRAVFSGDQPAVDAGGRRGHTPERPQTSPEGDERLANVFGPAHDYSLHVGDCIFNIY